MPEPGSALGRSGRFTGNHRGCRGRKCSIQVAGGAESGVREGLGGRRKLTKSSSTETVARGS